MGPYRRRCRIGGHPMNQLRAALSQLINRKGPIAKREIEALMFENPEPHTLTELELMTRAVNRAMGPYKAPQFAAQEIAEELIADGYALPLPPGIYPSPVQAFIDERPRYVAAARSFSNSYDYARWQGHMEARRQLAHDLGLTIPSEIGDTARPLPTAIGYERAKLQSETLNLTQTQIDILRGTGTHGDKLKEQPNP